MIAFRGLRGGSAAPATLAPLEASPRRVSASSSGGDALRWPRKATLGRPCGFLRSPRAALVMDAITAAHAARRKTRKAVGCAILR